MIARRPTRIALLACLALAGCDGRAPIDSTTVASPATGAAVPPPVPPPATSTPTPAVDAGYTLLDAGVVAPTDTLTGLRARYGDDAVVSDKVPGAEGEELDGWIVFPADPARRVYVYLDDTGANPAMLRLLDPESRWQRADGIRMGRTLTELAQDNGAPVGFTGFDWDYGGSCCDWHGGRRAKDPPTGGMTLCPPQTQATSEPGYPMGDAQFDSDYPWVKAHPPVVCEFSVVLEPEPPAPTGQETPP